MNTESKSDAQTVPPVAEVPQASLTAASDASSLQDLTPPELDAIKGGPGGGGIWLNHNETTASDSDADEPAPTRAETVSAKVRQWVFHCRASQRSRPVQNTQSRGPETV